MGAAPSTVAGVLPGLVLQSISAREFPLRGSMVRIAEAASEARLSSREKEVERFGRVNTEYVPELTTIRYLDVNAWPGHGGEPTPPVSS